MAAGASYRRDGDVIEFVVHRPERRNALGAAEWAVLDAAIAEAESGAGDFILLRAEGEFFCAGIDLTWIDETRRGGNLLKLIEDNGETLRRLDKLSQFVIVAVNGPAWGIGTHVALCGDVLLITRSCYFAFPEAKLGIPDVMHFQWLEQRLGRHAAIDMTVLGLRLSAADAVARGVAGHLYDDANALAIASQDYLKRFRGVDPSVRRAIKTAANGRADTRLQLDACRAVIMADGRRPQKNQPNG